MAHQIVLTHVKQKAPKGKSITGTVRVPLVRYEGDQPP